MTTTSSSTDTQSFLNDLMNARLSQLGPAVTQSTDEANIQMQALVSAYTGLQAFAATPQGQSVLKMEPGVMNSLFQGSAAADWYETLVSMVEKVSTVQLASVSIMGQAEFIVGAGLAVGYVTSLAHPVSDSTLFGGLGLLEGVDAGAELALCAGVWTTSINEVGGLKLGVELDLTADIGLDGIVFGEPDAIRNGLKSFRDGGDVSDLLAAAQVVFVGVDIGLEMGADGDEYVFLADHLDDGPQYQRGPFNYMVMLQDLQCISAKSSLGNNDNVWMQYTVDGKAAQYRYPIWGNTELDEKDSNQWQCGGMIRFNDYVEITLSAQAEGTTESMTQTLHASDFTGPYTTKTLDFDNNETGTFENRVHYTLTAQQIYPT